jgi:hypothetical protein
MELYIPEWDNTIYKCLLLYVGRLATLPYLPMKAEFGIKTYIVFYTSSVALIDLLPPLHTHTRAYTYTHTHTHTHTLLSLSQRWHMIQ